MLLLLVGRLVTPLGQCHSIARPENVGYVFRVPLAGDIATVRVAVRTTVRLALLLLLLWVVGRFDFLVQFRVARRWRQVVVRVEQRCCGRRSATILDVQTVRLGNGGWPWLVMLLLLLMVEVP